MANYAPWPKFRCHKVVTAQKITKINAAFGEFVLLNGEVYCANGRMLEQAKPGWYLVAYDDGYVSCSPPEAFEAGYTLIEG